MKKLPKLTIKKITILDLDEKQLGLVDGACCPSVTCDTVCGQHTCITCYAHTCVKC